MDILWLYKDKQKQTKSGNFHVIIGRIAAKAQLTEAKLQGSKEDPPQSLASSPQSWEPAELLQSLQTLLGYTWLLNFLVKKGNKLPQRKRHHSNKTFHISVMGKLNTWVCYQEKTLNWHCPGWLPFMLSMMWASLFATDNPLQHTNSYPTLQILLLYFLWHINEQK